MIPIYETEFQIDAWPRRRRLLDPAPSKGYRLGEFALRRDHTVAVVTPAGTPGYLELSVLESTLDYARRLVTAAPETPTRVGRISTQRTVIGDARDLLVHALKQCLGAEAPDMVMDDDVSAEHSTVVHIGPTRQALEILQAVAGGPDELQGWNHWDGRTETLDADGYIHLCLTDPDLRTHLLLLGGTAYGTYFSVADFLHTHLGARWLMPGRLGTVLPPRNILLIPAGDQLNRIEEPDIRSRNLSAVMNSNQMGAEECDDVRNWLLRNRYRPFDERQAVFYTTSNSNPERAWASTNICAPPASERNFLMAMLQHEARLPAYHNMRAHLSPFKPSTLPGFSGTARANPASMLHVYPDVRPRLIPTLPDEALGSMAPRHRDIDPSGLDSRLGIQRIPDLQREVDERHNHCGGQELFTIDDNASLPRRVPRVLRLVDGPTEPVYDAFMRSYGTLNDQFVDMFPQTMRDGAMSSEFQRYIPQSWLDRHEGTLYPFDQWHPCLFEYRPSLPYYQYSNIHGMLSLDIATQVFAATSARADAYEGVAGYSLAFDDGATWCHCDACDRVVADGGAGNEILFWFGISIAYPRSRLERFEGGMLDHHEGRERLRDVRQRNFSWNEDLLRNPFRDMTLDELSVYGLIHDSGFSKLYSRRVLEFENSVCVALRAIGADQLYPQLNIAFLAYNSYIAAPILSPFVPRRAVGSESTPLQRVLSDPTAYLDGMLMPYITSRRDTSEYEDLGDDVWPMELEPGTIAGAFQRMRDFPEQFNHDRWSIIARRTGFYEYFWGAAHVAPAIYSRRLYNALHRGFRQFGLRGFTSETLPNWALEGPMYWELSRALWNTSTDVPSSRADFCGAAFGPGAAGTMQQYFDLCEAAWSSTRDEREVFTRSTGRAIRSDRRSNGDLFSGYYGHAVVGRGSFLSQLEGWYRVSRGAADSRLHQARDLLDNALRQALRRRDASLTPEARDLAQQCVDRVQYYRRTFGLMYLIAEWYQPIHQAFERIRENNPSDELVAMQYPSKIYGTFVTFQVPAGSTFPTDIVGGSVAVAHAGIRAEGEMGGVATASDQILAGVLRRLGGTDRRWTLRGLRNQVHRYIASHALTSAEMPTLQSWLSRLPDDADHQLGMCNGELQVYMDDETDPGQVVANVPSRARGDVGLYLPTFMPYLDWWRGCVYADGAGTMRLAQARDDQVAAGDNASSFGWVFSELKYMCGFVLLYGELGLREGLLSAAKQRILRG